MKTKTNLPDSRTLDDIVFENRNKEYGAYSLNKNHRKYLAIAFLISLTGVSTAIAVPFINALNGKYFYGVPGDLITVIIDPVKPDEIIAPPPPPPPPDGDLVSQTSYKPPIVVENATEEEIIPMSDLVDRPNNPPAIDLIPDPVPPAPEIPEATEPPMTTPQEFASFMNGGLVEFAKWVQQTVIYPEIAIQNRIAGKVIVSFCVNKTGEVVDIKLLRGIDKSVDQEILRVISSSPLWKAARQGGRPVKQQFVIPVTFVLN
jgi:protein TonB